jgi:hypothetical protein
MKMEKAFSHIKTDIWNKYSLSELVPRGSNSHCNISSREGTKNNMNTFGSQKKKHEHIRSKT